MYDKYAVISAGKAAHPLWKYRQMPAIFNYYTSLDVIYCIFRNVQKCQI